MIEYVAKNRGDALPKNIRQVGDVDLDKRVYIEDYAFSFVRELVPDEDEEARVGILLGKETEKDGENFVFVKAAMEVTNASVFEGKIAFTEETWPSVNNNKNLFFGNMDIVGWFIVSNSIRVQKNISIERTHVDSFGKYKLLLYMNPAEMVEDMYSCFDGGLETLDGYIIYFEKNDEMQAYMQATKSERRVKDIDLAISKRYRQLVRNNSDDKKAKKNISIVYAMSAVLVIFVLVIGVGRLQSKNNTADPETQNGVHTEQTIDVNATLAPVPDETLNVDYVQGDVEPTKDTSGLEDNQGEEQTSDMETSMEENTSSETDTESQTEEPQTEEQTTQAVNYKKYVIKQGDSISRIIIEEYGDLSRLEEVLKFNNIENPDLINIGDEILLPN